MTEPETIEPVVLQTYTLQILGPEHGREFTGVADELLREAEENLSDLLPTGYSVRIKEQP